MAHKSYRGKHIDMDTLRKANEDQVAMGNMKVNAKGDKLGRGGEIVESASSRTRKHYNTTSTTRQTVSIKDDADDQAVFPEEVAPKAKKKTKTVEREDSDGNIVINEAEDDS